MTLKNITSEIPKEIVDSLNEIILEKTPTFTREVVNERVKHLEGLIRDNQRNTKNVRSAIIQLQDRVENQSINSFDIRDQTVYSLEGSNQGSQKTNATRREREVLRKGIERMQKQIFQLISVQISQEHLDIALLKKCKTIDIPASCQCCHWKYSASITEICEF